MSSNKTVVGAHLFFCSDTRRFRTGPDCGRLGAAWCQYGTSISTIMLLMVNHLLHRIKQFHRCFENLIMRSGNIIEYFVRLASFFHLQHRRTFINTHIHIYGYLCYCYPLLVFFISRALERTAHTIEETILDIKVDILLCMHCI